MQSHNTRRDFLKAMGMGVVMSGLGGCGIDFSRLGGRRRPNIVLMFTDDQGYQDVGVYGAQDFETPHLDRMAEDGIRFTDFYVAGASCTPSRAALLTGCYPQRVSLPRVLGPSAKIGIHSEEETLADILKGAGYRCGCFGKWHLGHHPKFLPTRHGFDEYFGLPYSNDMWPKHPTNRKFPDLPLIEGERIIEYNPDQTQLTKWYTQRAVRFIERHHKEPFFLYLPHSMPHVPLHVSKAFAGKSAQGLYGDVIMEIDWSMGQIVSTLERLGIERDTLVIFATDNGPWLSYGDHAGSAEPLREGKGTTFDGGQRVPCLMRWPGAIPAGQVCSELITAMDILPTVAKLTGAKLPKKKIDGKDIRPLMTGGFLARSPHKAFFFYRGNTLEAVRSGRWKLHLPHSYRHLVKGGQGGQPGKYSNEKIGLTLFDLSKDIGEQQDLSAKYPKIVKRLSRLAKAFDQELKQNRREPGRVEHGEIQPISATTVMKGTRGA